MRGDRHGKLDADQLAPAPRAPRGEHLDQRLAHHLCVRSGCSDDDSPGWHDEVGRPRDGSERRPDRSQCRDRDRVLLGLSGIKQMPRLCSGCRVSHIMSRHPTAACERNGIMGAGNVTELLNGGRRHRPNRREVAARRQGSTAFPGGGNIGSNSEGSGDPKSCEAAPQRRCDSVAIGRAKVCRSIAPCATALDACLAPRLTEPGSYLGSASTVAPGQQGATESHADRFFTHP
jgi:hypothetical protein